MSELWIMEAQFFTFVITAPGAVFDVQTKLVEPTATLVRLKEPLDIVVTAPPPTGNRRMFPGFRFSARYTSTPSVARPVTDARVMSVVTAPPSFGAFTMLLP